MILVDTCVWIDLLQNGRTPEVSFLTHLLKTPSREVCVSHIIYFELLRGIPADWERKRVQKQLDRLTFQDYTNDHFETLIHVYRSCQKKGFTLSKLGDWLILKTVLDHSLELLTSDRDFYTLRNFLPNLNLVTT